MSSIRAAYGPWIRKKILSKLKIVGWEKTAVGFPYVQVLPGYETVGRAKELFELLSFHLWRKNPDEIWMDHFLDGETDMGGS